MKLDIPVQSVIYFSQSKIINIKLSKIAYAMDSTITHGGSDFHLLPQWQSVS